MILFSLPSQEQHHWNILKGRSYKNEPQILPNFSGYKHAKRLEHSSSIGLSGVQKHLCAILGSWDISKSKWGIRFPTFFNIGQSRVLTSDVPYGFSYISAPFSCVLQKCVWTSIMPSLSMSILKWDKSQPLTLSDPGCRILVITLCMLSGI